MALPIYVAVIVIETGQILYRGSNYQIAAQKLDPGTCFGRGESEYKAQLRAEEWAALFRAKARKGRRFVA